MRFSQIDKEALSMLNPTQITDVIYGFPADDGAVGDVALLLGSNPDLWLERASAAAKLYLDGGDYSLMFDSFKPIGLISNIGILTPDNTFITKKGTVDLTGQISFEEEAARGDFLPRFDLGGGKIERHKEKGKRAGIDPGQALGADGIVRAREHLGDEVEDLKFCKEGEVPGRKAGLTKGEGIISRENEHGRHPDAEKGENAHAQKR